MIVLVGVMKEKEEEDNGWLVLGDSSPLEPLIEQEESIIPAIFPCDAPACLEEEGEGQSEIPVVLNGQLDVPTYIDSPVGNSLVPVLQPITVGDGISSSSFVEEVTTYGNILQFAAIAVFGLMGCFNQKN